MLKVTRERPFPRTPEIVNGTTSIRTIGIHFGPCVLDTGVRISPRLLLVHEFLCRLQNQRCIFSEVLLYDHQQNNCTTLLSSLPSVSRILSAAISPDGQLLAISTVTRGRGARYQYTITVTSLNRQEITASIRLKTPVDVCFPGNSSHLLLLTYIPILAKVFIKRTRMQTQQLIIHPMADPLHVFGEVLHIQSTPPYILTIELPISNIKYMGADGSRHMYSRLSGILDAQRSTQILVLRLYHWHDNQLNEIRRFPITLPARYKIYPFPGRGSIQSKSILIDFVTAPQPIAIFSCHSVGCTMIKVCACLTASMFTFSLAKPLQRKAEEVNKVVSRDNTQYKNSLLAANSSTHSSQSHYEYIKDSLHKFILLVHANYLFFIQPFSLSTAQVVIVALPPYGPMYIAYSTLIPFQICNLQAYHAIKRFSQLSTVFNSISKYPSQSQYILHYVALSLVGMSKEQILADMHASRTAMDCILEYVKSPMNGHRSYADTPFGFVSYTDLAKVYMHNRVRRIVGLPDAPKIDMDVLNGLSSIKKEECLNIDAGLPHPAAVLSSLITAALNETGYGRSTITKTSSKTTDSNIRLNAHQDISATNFSASQTLAGSVYIPSAMHTYQTDYTDENHVINALNNPSIGSLLSSFTELNLMYSDIHSINNSTSDFLNSTIVTTAADTTAFDDIDEQSSQKRSRFKELSVNTIVSKRRLLFPQILGKRGKQKSKADLDTSMMSVTSKKVTSSKTPSQSQSQSQSNANVTTTTTTTADAADVADVADVRNIGSESIESDCANLSLEMTYLGRPISGSINFPMQSTIDVDSFFKYVPQPSYASIIEEINEICHLSRPWRYSVIPSYCSSTEQWSNEVTFTVFDMLLQRQIDLTIDLSQVSIGLCYPPRNAPTCIYEARLLRLNHKLVYLYHRYTQLVNINLLTIASNINIPSAFNTLQLHNLHVKWWERTLRDLRINCILEYSILVICLLEKVSTSLKIINPEDSKAAQFSSLVLKTLLLNTCTAKSDCPLSLAINLYSNPLHIFLHSVTQHSIILDSPWSKCTTMYAAHSYLHINNTVDNCMLAIQPYADTAGTMEQTGLSLQNISIYDQSVEKNIRFGAGKAVELYKYMAADSICPIRADSYAQKCHMELKKYVSNVEALAMITPRLSNFSKLITQHSSNQLSTGAGAEAEAGAGADTGTFIDTSILCTSDNFDVDNSLDNYSYIWQSSAIYREFTAIVAPFYPGIADTFFKQLYADVIFMCEACIGIDSNLLIEELNLLISICESLNLNLMGHRSTNRVFKRALALLYDRFLDSTLQEMLDGYL